MTRSKRFATLFALTAVCSAALIPAGSASAAVVVKNINVQGSTNDGWFSWTGQLDPWLPAANDITVKSGSTKFFFVWGFGLNNPGVHNVTLKKTGANNGWLSGQCKTSACTATTKVTQTFTNSPLQQNNGTADVLFPSKGWTPTAPKGKKYLYSIVCSLHSSNMKMRVFVQG